MTLFQQAFYQRRQERNETQWEAAFSLGVDPATICRWERGRTKPDCNRTALQQFMGMGKVELEALMATEVKPETRKQKRLTELRRLREEVREAEEVLDIFGIPKGLSLWRRVSLLGGASCQVAEGSGNSSSNG